MPMPCQMCGNEVLAVLAVDRLEEHAKGDDLIVCGTCVEDCKDKATVVVKRRDKNAFLVRVTWHEDVEPITDDDFLDCEDDEQEL